MSGSLLLIDKNGPMDRFQYTVRLFKMQDDSYLFDNFESLFESAQIPNLNESLAEFEWIPAEVRRIMKY